MNEPIGIIAVLADLTRRFDVAGREFQIPRKDLPAVPVLAEPLQQPKRKATMGGEARESTIEKPMPELLGSDSRGGGQNLSPLTGSGLETSAPVFDPALYEEE